jgi:glycerol-3-phosphate O-acyltransferase
LSVILDAYLDGTIDDALLVPVALNYDKLVDGNFVREQLGMPKQMETFWSALRGIWRTLNTDHGTVRVDFNQPISLKVPYHFQKLAVDKSHFYFRKIRLVWCPGQNKRIAPLSFFHGCRKRRLKD